MSEIVWVAREFPLRELPDVGKRIRAQNKDTMDELLSLLRNRILRQVEIRRTQECIEFPSLDEYGYGRIKWGRSRIGAHRAAYMAFVGEVAEGLVIDHLCRNHGCVNPDHLEPVTNAENVQRGVGITAINAGKTHCKNGHEFTAENTYSWPLGKRVCKMCHRAKIKRLSGRTLTCPACGKTVARANLNRHLSSAICEMGARAALVELRAQFGVTE